MFSDFVTVQASWAELDYWIFHTVIGIFYSRQGIYPYSREDTQSEGLSTWQYTLVLDSQDKNIAGYLQESVHLKDREPKVLCGMFPYSITAYMITLSVYVFLHPSTGGGNSTKFKRGLRSFPVGKFFCLFKRNFPPASPLKEIRVEKQPLSGENASQIR